MGVERIFPLDLPRWDEREDGTVGAAEFDHFWRAMDGWADAVHSDLLLPKPLVVWNGRVAANTTNSTTTKVIYQNLDITTAPFPGRLIVQVAGRVGFNASAVNMETFLSANNGGSVDTEASSFSNAPAGSWAAMAVSAHANVLKDESLGFELRFKTNLATGSVYVRGHASAILYPSHLLL